MIITSSEWQTIRMALLAHCTTAPGGIYESDRKLYQKLMDGNLDDTHVINTKEIDAIRYYLELTKSGKIHDIPNAISFMLDRYNTVMPKP